MKLKKLNLAIVLGLTIIFSGCETQPVIVQPAPLPIPTRPIFPSITPAQLQCLSDEAYTDLIKRDRMRKAYEETLEAIIKSTHK